VIDPLAGRRERRERLARLREALNPILQSILARWFRLRAEVFRAAESLQRVTDQVEHLAGVGRILNEVSLGDFVEQMRVSLSPTRSDPLPAEIALGEIWHLYAVAAARPDELASRLLELRADPEVTTEMRRRALKVADDLLAEYRRRMNHDCLPRVREILAGVGMSACDARAGLASDGASECHPFVRDLIQSAELGTGFVGADVIQSEEKCTATYPVTAEESDVPIIAKNTEAANPITSPDGEILMEALERLGDAGATAIASIAMDAEKGVDQKLREIYAIDPSRLGWKSAQWAKLLGCTRQAVERCDWWKYDRPRLIGRD
jgi:hypothetical protein